LAASIKAILIVQTKKTQPGIDVGQGREESSNQSLIDRADVADRKANAAKRGESRENRNANWEGERERMPKERTCDLTN